MRMLREVWTLLENGGVPTVSVRGTWFPLHTRAYPLLLLHTLIRSFDRCFCGATPDPKPPRFATPHSCASPCSRARKSCEHSCPLQCHPGPCPPCAVTLSISCHCGKEVKGVRCSHVMAQARSKEGAGGGGIGDVKSCGMVCGKVRGCGVGEHTCEEICHEGSCGSCEVTYERTCWCGKESRSVLCGSNEHQTGGYTCTSTCSKTFACGVHACQEGCHTHERAEEEKCPFDPGMMKWCPCGKVEVVDGGGRVKCTDEVVTCGDVCGRELGCGHLCLSLCEPFRVWYP